MLKRGERICPCCGKPLVLMGKVLGDKYHEWYPERKNTIAEQYRDTFERDKLWGNGVKMYCSECGVRIKLRDDPFFVFDIASFLIVLALVITSVIAALSGTNILPVALPIIIVVEIALFIRALIQRNNIMKYSSNFTFTEEAIPIFDGEFDFEPNIRAAVEPTETQRKYYRSGNVFETRLSSLRVFLYLVSLRENGSGYELELRFCGTVDEVERYAASLKNSEVPVKLPLIFEGIPVGTAEITEIYDNKDRGL
ncbi:MAG: hypothetical protein HDT43_12760 [Ruminococcaceae bacterium]|nr:hypothetical protein [Oscillospiraceae bacterium]